MDSLKNALHRLRKKLSSAKRRDWQIYCGAGVFALLVLAAVFSLPRADSRAKAAADEAMLLAERIRAHYRAKPNYWGLDNAYAMEADIVPPEMVRGGKIINSMGQTVFIGQGVGGDAVMPGSRGFDISFANVNKKSCMLLMSHHFEEEQALGLTGVTLLNTQERNFSGGESSPFPLQISETRDICDSRNTIIWNFE